MEQARGLILAGGEGGTTSLLPVANKPVLVHGIEAMRDAGVREVAIAVSPGTRRHVAQAVARAAPLEVEVQYVETERPLSMLDALVAAKDFLAGAPCIAHQGDGVLHQEMRPLVDEIGRGDLDALILVHHTARDQAPSSVDDGRLLRLLGRTRRRLAGIALTGVHLFGPRFLERGANPRARTVKIDGWWRRIADADALLETNRLLLEDLEPGTAGASIRDSSVQGRVAIHRTARLESAVVRGPAIIGARAVVRDAYIGPYTAIGEGVSVEGAEIEHSIVLPDARIEYLGGRLEASVVGRRAHVHRDFGLPRAFRLRVGDGTEVSLA